MIRLNRTPFPPTRAVDPSTALRAELRLADLPPSVDPVLLLPTYSFRTHSALAYMDLGTLEDRCYPRAVSG